VSVGTLEVSERSAVMRRPVVLTIAAFMVGSLLSCSVDDDSSSTTEEQTTVAVEDETTITTTQEDRSTTSDSPPDSGSVTVTTDVRFADASPDLALWSDPLLDVYSPREADNLPLVVLLTPHGFTKDNPATVQLANGVAERGAVVVVANWSQQEDPPETFEDPAALTEMARAGQSLAGCAVAFAASQAAEFGADPSRLVLVGELYGANTASMVALGTADPSPGCLAVATEWSATGLVGLNADWLATAPYFDAVASAAVEVFSPWALLGQAPTIPTKLVVTSDAVTVARRCDDRDAEWMTSRDPAGAMREQLDAVGAYADGCVDIGDEAEAMAAEMSAHSLPAEVVWLTDPDATTSSGPGGQVLEFGQADLTLLVDTIMDAV
jgi:acetyl esterase/lipase